MHPPRRSLLFVLAVVMAAWPALAADLELASENAVRAVLLYNFLSFADLPGNGADQKALHICVAARDPELLAAMERLQERRIRGRTLYAQGFGPDIHCDAIYIDSRARWQAMSEGAGAPRALTVGFYPGFVDDGGIVEVGFQEGRARFDINLAAARRAGIRLYPQLLRLARRVLE
ncbi:MAG: YfiR family protein [Thiobacillaceae bacterium]|jgi:hypothetical protein|nr:YfiR family protein [Thiobacillaceae bacterium]MBP9914913.1 YfiR family protein [Thiobacillaceae bacterium]